MCSRLKIVLLFPVIGFLFFCPPKVLAAFNIDSVSPTTITSPDEVITLSVSATNLDNIQQYFQAAITKEGESDYFGFTNNGTDWKKYESKPDYTTCYPFTPINKIWSGQIQAKIDTTDSGYDGPGNYTIKLIKYITSSSGASSNNTATININLVSDSPPSVNPPSNNVDGDSQTNTKIDFSPPTNLPVATTLSIPIQAINLPVASYYIKVRIGPDESHLGQGQTYSGSTWLNDSGANGSWVNFPKTTESSSWQGNINARLSSGEPAGSYKIQIKFAKTTDTKIYFESAVKEINFQPEEKTNVSPATNKSPAPSSTITTTSSKTVSIEPATSLQNNFKEDDSFEASIDGKILGVNISSASPTMPPLLKNNPKIKKTPNQKNNFPVGSLIISTGLFFFGFAGVWSIRSRKWK